MTYRQPANDEWKKLILTPEEAHEKMLREYHVDPDTGDVLGPKQTFTQYAIHHGIDLDPPVDVWDYANELVEMMEAQSKREDMG